MVKWAGEREDIFANKIKQLIGLAGFEGAEIERLTKLTFVTGFPDTISNELRQASNIETLTKGDLLARARVLTTTEDQSQDVVAAVRSPHSGATPPVKSDPLASITCYKCRGKDCQKRGTLCYRCREFGHWARDRK